MNKKISFLPLLLTLSAILVSCQNQTIIKSPNEDLGLEGNASNDKVEDNSIEELKSLLNSASHVTKYSYEITATILDDSTHFINYFTPYAWYPLLYTKLLQKSEMRKDIVIELSYKGFS